MLAPANPHVPEDEVWIERSDGVIVIPMASWKNRGPLDDTRDLVAWQSLYPDAWFRPASDPLVQAHWAWKDDRVKQLLTNLDSDEGR